MADEELYVPTPGELVVVSDHPYGGGRSAVGHVGCIRAATVRILPYPVVQGDVPKAGPWLEVTFDDEVGNSRKWRCRVRPAEPDEEAAWRLSNA